MENKKPQPPIAHIRIGGIEVSIWQNEFNKTITMQRSYIGKDNKWHNVNNLRTNDIPAAIIALQKAYEDIRTGKYKKGVGSSQTSE